MNNGKLKVLLVEDSEDDALLILRELEKDGLDPTSKIVETAGDYTAALSENSWDVIISDYSMPNFSGVEALRMLKDSGRDIPFVMVSGAIGEETAVETMKAGAHDFIVKGNYARLAQAIRRELTDARDRREKRRAEEALRESEERLKAIVDNTTAVIFVKDMEGRYTLVNRRLAEIIGEPKEEIAGKTDHDLMPREVAYRLRRNDLAALEAGKAMEFEEILSHDNGHRAYLSIKFPLLDSSGRPYGVCGVATDITERKKAEDELREARDAAEEAVRLKDKFVALVAHDLKSPFGSMLGLLELISRDGDNPLPVKHKEMIRSIIKNGRRMYRMIDELLRADRIQKAKINLRREKVDAVSLMASAIDNLKERAREKGIIIVNDIPEGMSLYVDPALFLEVLDNLISNAIKFSHRGGVVTVFAPDGAAVAVRDSGVGVRPDKLDKLFCYDEKTTTVGTDGEIGSGLGLPLCHEIIKAHGGSITVESAEGKGSVFCARLRGEAIEEV
ncbi:MAG: PAS domain-containing protein [Candidatus Nitrospinota bacterium M3_3B_026]